MIIISVLTMLLEIYKILNLKMNVELRGNKYLEDTFIIFSNKIFYTESRNISNSQYIQHVQKKAFKDF